jgi:hypothetical protein
MPPSEEQVAALLSKREATIRRLIGERDAMKNALKRISAMDAKGIRADDLGRAARIASEAISAHTRPTCSSGDK